MQPVFFFFFFVSALGPARSVPGCMLMVLNSNSLLTMKCMYLIERETIEATHLAQNYCKSLSPAARQMSSSHGLKYLHFDQDILLSSLSVFYSTIS